MNLSKNLTLKEVTKSSTADRLGIKNDNISDQVLARLQAIADNIFQPARNKFGRIKISSGYRCPELNKAIGGASSSQHTKGEALDIEGIDSVNSDIFYFIRDNLKFDQLIWEFGNDQNPDWIHVSYRDDGNNRLMVLKAIKVNGKTKYEKFVGYKRAI